MNLWRDISPTLTAQLTVSEVNNRVIWCPYKHNVRCFLWLVIWGYRLEAITISMTNYSLIFWMADHIPALTTLEEIDVTHAPPDILSLTDSLYNGRQITLPLTFMIWK